MTLDVEPSSGVADLEAAVCSDGAPSARNLLVTVFGDVVAPVGPATELAVQVLTAVLEDFGVSERLVRTSLTRLVNDGLLTTRSRGRRSAYRVAPAALDLFAAADERIYRGRPEPWDGQWTFVILDGAEATAERRQELRQELGSAGLGVVAPNVLASPVVSSSHAADVVHRIGGFEHVVVMRSTVVPGSGVSDPATLARRCVDLDRVETGYAVLADRLAAFDDDVLARLDDRRAAKLRLLVVSTFRRLVLADPMLPAELLPPDWAGVRARDEAARCYAAIAERSDRHLTAVLGLPVSTGSSRFERR